MDGQLLPSSKSPSQLSRQETADLAKVFCILWFLACWTFNSSLQFTSVASCSILASTSGLITLIVGRIFNVETFSFTRLGTVIACFIGVTLVSLSDSGPSLSPNTASTLSSSTVPSGRNPILGDFLAFLSTVFYALYVTLIKVRVGDESRINMRLFFGYVGIYNLVTLWILGIILHLMGIEPFALPETRRQWCAIVTNTIINVLADFLYVIALLKTTPLIVTVGLSPHRTVRLAWGFHFH
ncbi:uncharacterized protein EI90DRAFT_2143248 [Cantharellus anzutake]|uniref:uncharacterized protein n=1 Tax=Cantharellus anzutake TaxID=1750568 RepID=UPI0019067182|nr:uncharacterized protein EI90DRAFT_2143248 [Cantharellus anzutake]KAF8325465.1 hypothetical protein EI90DRAFT_2143248 [Cantharellus anzutake]